MSASKPQSSQHLANVWTNTAKRNIFANFVYSLLLFSDPSVPFAKGLLLKNFMHVLAMLFYLEARSI